MMPTTDAPLSPETEDDFVTDAIPDEEPVEGEATETEPDDALHDKYDEDSGDVEPATDEEEGYDEDDPRVDHSIYGDTDREV